jgi:hypothetical protein
VVQIKTGPLLWLILEAKDLLRNSGLPCSLHTLLLWGPQVTMLLGKVSPVLEVQATQSWGSRVSHLIWGIILSFLSHSTYSPPVVGLSFSPLSSKGMAVLILFFAFS